MTIGLVGEVGYLSLYRMIRNCKVLRVGPFSFNFLFPPMLSAWFMSIHDPPSILLFLVCAKLGDLIVLPVRTESY